jgi:hypothetical protein
MDTDPNAHLERFGLAQEFDIDIDLHLDSISIRPGGISKRSAAGRAQHRAASRSVMPPGRQRCRRTS